MLADGQPDANLEKFLADFQGLVSQFPGLKSIIKKSIAYGNEAGL
jgi:hypothetical protein